MLLQMWFWLTMFLWLILGAWWGWADPTQRWGRLGGMLLPFLALALVGWKVFGGPIAGD